MAELLPPPTLTMSPLSTLALLRYSRTLESSLPIHTRPGPTSQQLIVALETSKRSRSLQLPGSTMCTLAWQLPVERSLGASETAMISSSVIRKSIVKHGKSCSLSCCTSKAGCSLRPACCGNQPLRSKKRSFALWYARKLADLPHVQWQKKRQTSSLIASACILRLAASSSTTSPGVKHWHTNTPRSGGSSAHRRPAPGLPVQAAKSDEETVPATTGLAAAAAPLPPTRPPSLTTAAAAAEASQRTLVLPGGHHAVNAALSGHVSSVGAAPVSATAAPWIT
mmetsp:Transcript_18786/g.47147  ORF Transcript_18786/g.47147 Transcript_18786/m.47147 type:complete len:281 (+) Transcript_18786:914-1756(+)